MRISDHARSQMLDCIRSEITEPLGAVLRLYARHPRANQHWLTRLFLDVLDMPERVMLAELPFVKLSGSSLLFNGTGTLAGLPDEFEVVSTSGALLISGDCERGRWPSVIARPEVTYSARIDVTFD